MIRVRVPATTANLGPGYDCMGLAVKLYNDFIFEEEIGWENSPNNLIFKSMEYLFEKVGYKEKGIKITVEGKVPQSRGLGSSATCIVGGLIGANEISGANLSRDEILELATEIEGHPDNVAPALLGGLVSSVYDNKVYYNRYLVSQDLKYYFLVPDFELSTKAAREILPKYISLGDAIYNMSRSVLIPDAFSKGDYERLKVLLKDKLHQDYRRGLIHGFTQVQNSIGDSGIVALSGAGPTMFVISKGDINKLLESILKEHNLNWAILDLVPDNDGARIIEEE